ncbi:MAG: RNA polymerase sigma factor, partial [Actinomycetota bacterium]|nr:RNA polymerase sigma factor [Actinomycetota bacterium]
MVAATLLRLRSDEQLVAAFRQGHEAAFQVIHDRYRARLFAYARQMLGGSTQDAEDALQDVFLRAYNALRADARPITLRAWLYRVAHNRCIDQMRRPVPVPVEASEDSPSEAPEPMVAAQQREDLRRLVTDIRALPQQQRSALLMREMDGMTYTELGAALGVTTPAVKSLLVRARMALAETAEAREADCQEIRTDLAGSHDRGVRSSGRARRHLRDCHGCRAYRLALKGTSSGIAALGPASPGLLAGLAQALGLGGAGSGSFLAGAGGGVATGSSALAVGVTTTKVAAVLGAAALAAGGVAEVEKRIGSPAAPTPEGVA